MAAAVTAEDTLIEAIVEQPENSGNPILIKTVYKIPDNRYQTDNHDFFTFRILEPESFKLTPVIYPDGTLKDGEKIYTGKTVLTAGLIIPETIKSGDYVLNIEAGYQFCSFAGDCFFPQKVVIKIPISVD